MCTGDVSIGSAMLALVAVSQDDVNSIVDQLTATINNFLIQVSWL